METPKRVSSPSGRVRAHVNEDYERVMPLVTRRGRRRKGWGRKKEDGRIDGYWLNWCAEVIGDTG